MRKLMSILIFTGASAMAMHSFAASDISVSHVDGQRSLAEPNHHRGCHNIEWPRRCENTRGCYWDYRRDRCMNHGGGGGGGGGHGNHCSDIYDRHRCENTDGCDWSWRQDRCTRDRGHHH